MKNNRNLPGNNVQDTSTIANLTYNEMAGAQKNTDVGRYLVPIPWNNAGVIAYTTDATAAKALSKNGANIAVYNNSGVVQSVTFGKDATVVSLGVGATDAAGNVGVVCMPNEWTYLSSGDRSWVISSSATLLVYIIYDETSIKQEAAR